MRPTYLTREETSAVPTPEATKTWKPISHKDVIESVTASLNDMDISITNEHYSLTKQGKNMFGVMNVDIQDGNDKIEYSIGMRNSHSKTFALGMVGGTCVTVCSNLQFSGDFINMRKHTAGLNIEVLDAFTKKSVAIVITSIKGMIEWQESLHQHEITDDFFKMATFDLINNGIIIPNKFREFIEFHDEEKEEYGEQSLFTLHGAVTRSLRNYPLQTVNAKTSKLNGLINSSIEMLEPAIPMLTSELGITTGTASEVMAEASISN